MRRFLRDALPSSIVGFVGTQLARRRSARLAALPIAEAFDEIYRKGFWRQGDSLSGCGSEGKWATDYAEFITDYMESYKCETVLDCGCGDFLVGARISPAAKHYIAADISRTVIDYNMARFKNLDNVEFRVLDLLKDPLPKVDLVLVRQVFQHLSNPQIELALANIESSGAGHILVTEHVYRPALTRQPNIDLGHHSVVTRVAMKSGIDLASAPFSRRCDHLIEIEPGPENKAEPDSILRISRVFVSR